MSTSPSYRADIDGLRAVAVLPVILFHAGFDWFSGGYVGVDVFFVISGYLITSILLREIRAGKFSIVHFYERRARRILPALFIVCLASLPFAWWLLPPAALTDFSQSLIATASFWSNILFWLESDYFAATAELKPLLHTWSLAIEEQFYVFFPLVLMALAKWQLRSLGLVVISFIVISYGIMVWGLPRYPEATFYLLPTRAWELMVGALIAIWHIRSSVHEPKGNGQSKPTGLLGFIGLGLIVLSIITLQHDTPFPSHWTLLPVIGTALIIAFSAPGQLCCRLLSNRLLVTVGLFSYSAYLWHQPIFAFTKHYVGGTPSPSAMLLLSGLSLLLAYVSWQYVEAPFRNKQKIARRPIFVLSGLATVTLIAVGTAGHINNGFLQERGTPELMAALETTQPSPNRDACHTQGSDYLPAAESCVYGGDDLSWAVFGDSHAVEPAFALAERLKITNHSVKHYSYSLCGPNYGVSVDVPAGCANWTQEVLKDLEQQPDIKNVLVAFRLNYYLFGPHEDNYPHLPSAVAPEDRTNVWQGLINTLNELNAMGKKVILLLQAPEPPTHIDNLLFNHQEDLSRVKGVPRTWWEQRNAYVNANLKELPAVHKIIDPTPMLCDKNYCYVTTDSQRALYFDDDHLSVLGARKILDTASD